MPAPFATVYLGGLLRPRRTFDALVEHPHALRFGAYSVAITGTVYSLVYFFLAHNGGRPTEFTPWLAIPAEDYYRWNFYLHLPSLLLAWVSAAGFAHLFARLLGGRGSFEGVLAVLGLGLSISSWATGLHDVVTTFLGYLGVIDQRWYEDQMNGPTLIRAQLLVQMTLYLVAFVVLFTKGLGAAHRLGTARAAVAGTLGFVVYQLVFVIFNR